MIKVLVAEDELPLLRGISRLIESLDEEFQVVMMAKTGKEALDYLENHSVDVLFTDINMPVVDGLQVLQYIHQKKPQILSVVISGYQDFSYAQQAVKYEAKRYLIKPVDKQELLLLLGQLKESLLSCMANKKDGILRQTLSGKSQVSKCSMQEATDIKQNIEFCKIYPVYFIAKSYCSHNIEEDVFDSDFWQEVNIRQSIEEELPDLKEIYTYDGKYPNEMILLLESEKEIDAYEVVSSVLKKKHLHIPLAAAAEGQYVEVEDLRRCIKQLRKMICINWVYGEIGLVRADGVRASFYMTKTTEEALQYMIKNGKFKDFQVMLTEIQKQMEAEKITQYDLELTLNKIVLFIQAYRAAFMGENIENMLGSINEIVMQSNSLKEVFDEFAFWCHDIMFPVAEENTEALVRRLDSYIHEHYTERLSTKMLAQEFGLVPSYLSRLFREYKGVTPNHYIQEIRIEKSKEILVNCPSIMTKDVALMVGYIDPSYFSKVFKKSTKMYPSEYRMENLQ